MHDEVMHAVAWWARQLPRGSLACNDEHVASFTASLTQRLIARYHGHWYHDEPHRGSAFRAIMNDHRCDPMLIHAARDAAIPDIADLIAHARCIMFVNPGEVKVKSVSMGVDEWEAPVETIYSSSLSPSSISFDGTRSPSPTSATSPSSSTSSPSSSLDGSGSVAGAGLKSSPSSASSSSSSSGSGRFAHGTGSSRFSRALSTSSHSEASDSSPPSSPLSSPASSRSSSPSPPPRTSSKSPPLRLSSQAPEFVPSMALSSNNTGAYASPAYGYPSSSPTSSGVSVAMSASSWRSTVDRPEHMARHSRRPASTSPSSASSPSLSPSFTPRSSYQQHRRSAVGPTGYEYVPQQMSSAAFSSATSSSLSSASMRPHSAMASAGSRPMLPVGMSSQSQLQQSSAYYSHAAAGVNATGAPGVYAPPRRRAAMRSGVVVA